MNVVLLYGNGFDQSYRDFLKWMEDNRKDNFTPAVFEFLNIIKAHEGDNLWIDFESALGFCQYSKMSSCEGFQSFNYASNIVFAIQDLFRSFLNEKCQRIYGWGVADEVGEMFNEGFVRLCRENGIGFGHCVENEFITLNYTHTLETILHKDVVFHPHGSLNSCSPLIFGVDSVCQLKHLVCGEFARVLCKKSQIEENTIRGENKNDKLMRMIKCADVLILFGLSFGCTDYRIWKTAGQCAAVNGTKILLCPFGDDVVARFTQGVCQCGLDVCDVDESQFRAWEQIKKGVIVAKDSRNDFLGLKAIKRILEQ